MQMFLKKSVIVKASHALEKVSVSQILTTRRIAHAPKIMKDQIAVFILGALSDFVKIKEHANVEYVTV
ncbi:hypothetical protein DPMN_038058 [Dreissena polymorpha]|uniref:Uncharacterized protein n=1 Tax=Dreissena polymorpha TaxID=45954 RepID=A0A9D4MCF4_DREPO|nr:hypothetical protein DPMN_038058 [Dreissena polymorpha]